MEAWHESEAGVLNAEVFSNSSATTKLTAVSSGFEALPAYYTRPSGQGFPIETPKLRCSAYLMRCRPTVSKNIVLLSILAAI